MFTMCLWADDDKDQEGVFAVEDEEDEEDKYVVSLPVMTLAREVKLANLSQKPTWRHRCTLVARCRIQVPLGTQA